MECGTKKEKCSAFFMFFWWQERAVVLFVSSTCVFIKKKRWPSLNNLFPLVTTCDTVCGSSTLDTKLATVAWDESSNVPWTWIGTYIWTHMVTMGSLSRPCAVSTEKRQQPSKEHLLLRIA